MTIERHSSHSEFVGPRHQQDANTNGTIPLEVRPTLDAASIVFNASLVKETRNLVHSPFDRSKERKARRVLEAFDTISDQTIDTEVDKYTRKAVIISERLKDKKSDIVTASEKWSPIHERHHIIKAASTAANLGGPYLDIFMERSGITAEKLKQIREAVPPATETVKVLTEDQKYAAEAVSARMLFKKVIDASHDTPEGIIVRKPNMEKAGDILRAHIRIQQQEIGTSADEINAENIARKMLPELEEGRDKIFDKAQLWQKDDMARKIRAVSRDFKKLENPEVLQELTGITPEMVSNAKTKGKWEAAGSWLLAGGNEGLSHAPGIGAVTELNLHEKLPDNPWILGGATVLLYGGLLGSIVKTSYASADLLKSTGVGLDPRSKWTYDHAIDDERKAAVKGALQYHAAWEAPFFALGIGIGAKYGWEAGVTYFNAASLAGIAKNIVVNAGVEAFRAGQSKWDRHKELNSFLPNK